MDITQELQETLAKSGQLHLLDGWDKLSQTQRENLAEQIRSQDFPLLQRLFQDLAKSDPAHSAQESISPMPFSLATDHPEYPLWADAGESILRKGQAAAFLVAGGQGSRLGFSGPKGAYRVGLPSGKSIFQIQAERLCRLRTLYGKPVPWCIMTSPLNHADTVAHFEEHDYFGLEREVVRFFPQAMVAAMDTEGKILREAPDRLALVPDGNGGCFRALSRSGCLDWLESRGVHYVFLYGVDNILVKVCDPAFLGALACNPQLASASKVVSKRSPEEKVGIFALRDGKPGVIEYSDLPASLRDQRGSQGELSFDGGNIAVHLFRTDALRTLEHEPLPWHAAFKKVPHWTPAQGDEQPEAPNAWKFEQFLFDSFPILGSMLPFGVLRSQEFAPVKNASGDDSPATARRMLGELHYQWLHDSGISLNIQDLYEISPILSYGGEGLTPSVFKRELGHGIRSFQE